MLRKGYFSVKASHGALCGGVPQGSLSQSYSNTLQILPFSTLGLRMPLRQQADYLFIIKFYLKQLFHLLCMMHCDKYSIFK